MEKTETWTPGRQLAEKRDTGKDKIGRWGEKDTETRRNKRRRNSETETRGPGDMMIKEETRLERNDEICRFLCYFKAMIRFKPIPKDIRERIDSLVELFQSESNIIFSYLFGGLLKARVSPMSDVDLSVYVKNPERLDYLELFSQISELLGTDEIDLIILNDAPLSLAGRILQNRRVLVDKKPFIRHKYESLILREFFDFQIKERDILKRRYGIG